MWLFSIIAILSVFVAAENDSNCPEPQFRTSGTGMWSSFEKFKTDVTTFFKFNLDRLEKRRLLLKKAFKDFINTAFAEDTTSNDTTLVGNPSENAPPDTHAIFSYGPSKHHDVSSNYKANYQETKNFFPELNNKKYNKTELPSSEKAENIENSPEMSFEELVQAQGYNAESHTVMTKDGYILTLHRILLANENGTNIKSEAVLLHHGLLGSSDHWVLLGAKKALPYILLHANYDVWLANARGSKYSRVHATPSISDDDYWNFSWHEMGQYDLPAVIDYIKNLNENDVNLHYIGHSMGSTAVLVLLSIYPRYNHLLKSAILLAPMAYMYEVKGPLRLLAEFYKTNEHFRNYESLDFLKLDNSWQVEALPWNVVEKYCKGDAIQCMNPLLLLTNGGHEIQNKTLRSLILSHSPAGASVKSFIHYIQLVNSGQFQMYDLGDKRNLRKYGMIRPPIYRLNEITLPVAIFSSSDDWLATIPDVQSLIQSLQNVVIHHIVNSEFRHSDFVWGEDADILLYYLILDVIKEIKPKNKRTVAIKRLFQSYD